MSQPFTAEIRIFAGNFAPRGWAFCNGQTLPISQNTALFSLIGTTYGGDGRTTTALPDLKGRAPMHPGRGPGLTSRRLGQRGGSESATVSEAQMPSHTHTEHAGERRARNEFPSATATVTEASETTYATGNSAPAAMATEAVGNKGGSLAHDNLQPFLTLNYIIALVGLFPTRS